MYLAGAYQGMKGAKVGSHLCRDNNEQLNLG